MNRVYFIAQTSIGTMARPRGGDWLLDDLTGLKRMGIQVLVCLMEQAELQELLLEEEAADCKKVGLEFIHFPIPDFGLPANEDAVRKLVIDLKNYIEEGKKIAVHCRMGIGRSSTIAAATLIALGNHTTATAFEAIGKARGLDVPDTKQQIEWVERFEERWHRFL